MTHTTLIRCSRACLIACSVLSVSCKGILGSVRGHALSGHGVTITKVETLGIELRNFPGGRGLFIGHRITAFVHEAGPGAEESPGHTGFVRMPNRRLLFAQVSGTGIDLAWDRAFRGISAGKTFTACAWLPADQSASLMIAPSHPDPLKRFSYQRLP